MSENKKRYEVDLINLAGKLFKEWRRLSRFVIVGGVFGVIIALTTPKTYKSEVILAPEFSSGSNGLSDGLSDLASSFGFDIGSSKTMDAIYPTLYPEIFSSTDFLMSLYNVPVRQEKDPTVKTYKEHLAYDGKMSLLDYPKKWITDLLKPKEEKAPVGTGGKPDPFYVSSQDWKLIEALRVMIVCDVDKKTNVITITVNDQDPMVAAIMADTLQNRLQNYITEYRTKKARVDVEYYRQLEKEAKAAYDSVRSRYVSASDANMNMIRMSMKSRVEDLENEMSIKYSIYTQTVSQLKAAEAKLQDRTPAFTVLQRPVTNPKPSSTPKIFIAAGWTFLSFMIGAVWILFVIPWKKNRKERKQNKIQEDK